MSGSMNGNPAMEAPREPRKAPRMSRRFALFRDSSVRKVAIHGDIWGWFFSGK